jgi:hypothetical protein
MTDRRRGLTAEERMAALRRDRARLQRERMAREVAGPVWRRMIDVVPLLFRHEGTLLARVLCADRSAVIEALRDDAVFAGDTAMRLAYRAGFLVGGDVHAYLPSADPIERLVRQGLVDAAPCSDTLLVRPWAGPPRLLASVVAELPPSREAPGGQRIVGVDRLRRELVGTVGARADLFALLEQLEAGSVARP